MTDTPKAGGAGPYDPPVGWAQPDWAQEFERWNQSLDTHAGWNLLHAARAFLAGQFSVALRALPPAPLATGGEVELPDDVKAGIMHDDDRVQRAACIVAAIERWPGWINSGELITIRAHAHTLMEDLSATSPTRVGDGELRSAADRLKPFIGQAGSPHSDNSVYAAARYAHAIILAASDAGDGWRTIDSAPRAVDCDDYVLTYGPERGVQYQKADGTWWRQNPSLYTYWRPLPLPPTAPPPPAAGGRGDEGVKL